MSDQQNRRGRGRGWRSRGRGRGGYNNDARNHNQVNDSGVANRGQGKYQRGNQSTNRGRGRGGRSGREYFARNIGYGRLESKSTASPQDAVMFCHEESFTEMLVDSSAKKDWIDLMLSIIHSALQADDSLHGYLQALKTVLVSESTPFLGKTCIQRFSSDLEADSTMIDSLLRSLRQYLDIFHYLCTMDPLLSKSLIVHVKMVKQLLKGAVMDNEAFRVTYDLYSQATAEVDRLESEREKMEIRKKELMRTGRMVTDNRPVGDFREISVYPTEDDITERVQLRPNQTDKAFESVDDYLDIQFRLLREDFVSTIRQGIQEFRRNPVLRGPDRFRSGDIKIYENFQILSPTFGRSGMNYIVQIDLSGRIFQRINWESTKRLMYGSLLCLSQDGFDKNNLFAVIAEMDSKIISKDGLFEIQFLPDSQRAFDLLPHQGAPFMAIESTAYFEAYKHVLKGMQRLRESNFAFSKHIVRTETEVSSPEYTRFIVTNYRFITANNQVTDPVSILGEYGCKWPSAEELGFNESQYEAYKMALTKEFVVIQGPPGTGKTFIGLKIVETLLYNLYHVPYAELDKLTALSAQRKHSLASAKGNKNKRLEFCPEQRLCRMLIVCFTNHALDQFLEGMLNFCPIEEMVRVGSRSKNELLAQCNLKVKKVRRSGQLATTFYQLRQDKETFMEKNSIDKMNEEMEFTREQIVAYRAPAFFENYPAFYSQFQDFADKLEDNGENPDDAMSYWLQTDIISFAPANSMLFEDELPLEARYDQGIQESIAIEGEAERELQNRRIDLDLEDDFIRRIRKYSYMKSQQPNAVKRRGAKMDADGFIEVKKKKSKKALSGKIKRMLNSGDVMPETNVNHLHDMAENNELDITEELPAPDRWRLYRYLLGHYQGLIAEKMKALQDMYSALIEQSENVRMQQEIQTLQQAKVIGMTTTGAARLQSVLQQVGPEIIIVEEAAEVLEAHIITALSKHCKHLILIGDHKQLKPNPTVYELAKNYHLDLSLFERMVNNGLPVRTLNIQHRMRPEVSKYIRGHIYDKLDDHSSVLGRDPIEGVKSPVFFFNHNNPETSDEGTMSHSNQFEAKMVVGLTRYLLRQQSYKPEDITIITMYTGQLLTIKQMMPRFEFQGVKITSVDNFQGEENKILIISLVRSNPRGNLGFVKIENRVCVSLSRAQYGMYVFGNFDMLAEGSKLWRNMVDEAKMANEFGSQLHLSCQQHNNPAVIEQPADFDTKVPTGGCQLPCKARLECGHICKMKCHSKDVQHEFYKCTEPCPKSLTPCNHSCRAMCHQECPKCDIMLSKTLPCGHIRNVSCHLLHQEGYTVPCLESCPETLPCGHSCAEKCSQPCTTRCNAKVEQMCSKCNEMKHIPCHVATERLSSLTPDALKYSYQCDTPCDEILVCGHKCTGSCYMCDKDQHRKCVERCGKTLRCGHVCAGLCQDCTDRAGCGSCNKKCLIICSHGFKCTNRCHEDCLFTVKTSDYRCQWGCKHSKCERDCGEPCSFVPCDKSCDKMVDCKQCKTKYPCAGLCGEICPPMCPQCERPKKMDIFRQQVGFVDGNITAATRWIVLEDCNHLAPEEYINDLVYGVDPHTSVKCPYKDCKRLLINTRRYASRTRPVKSVSHQSFQPQIMNVQMGESKQNFQQKMSFHKNKSKQKKSNEPSDSLNPNSATFHPNFSGKHPQQPPFAGGTRAQQFGPPAPPKETAKERRKRRGRSPPPPRPDWLTLPSKKDDFYTNLQTVANELKMMKIQNEEELRAGPMPKREADAAKRQPKRGSFGATGRGRGLRRTTRTRHASRDSSEVDRFRDGYGGQDEYGAAYDDVLDNWMFD